MSDSAKSNWQGSDTMGCRIHILSHPHRGRVTPRVNWHTWSFSSLWFWGGRRRFTGTYMMLICVCLSLLAETPAVCSAARSRRWVTLDSLIKESSYILWTRCLSCTSTLLPLSLSFTPAGLHQTSSFISAPNFSSNSMLFMHLTSFSHETKQKWVP